MADSFAAHRLIPVSILGPVLLSAYSDDPNLVRRCHWGPCMPKRASGKSLPRRLARDAQRRPDLGPTNFARSKDIYNLLQLIALAFERILDWVKASQ